MLLQLPTSAPLFSDCQCQEIACFPCVTKTCLFVELEDAHIQEKQSCMVLISLTPLFLFIWVEERERERGWLAGGNSALVALCCYAGGGYCAPSAGALSLYCLWQCVSLRSLLLNADRPVTHFPDLDSQFQFSAHEVNMWKEWSNSSIHSFCWVILHVWFIFISFFN
jgi:hypothetical protein